MMSDRLTDNNPAIANLSDPKRPTKLAELFSELYDNEWTEAYASLTDNITINSSPQQTTQKLLDVALNIYKTCREKADEEIKEITKLLLRYSGGAKSTHENDSCLKKFKDERKRYYANSVKDIDVTEVIDRVFPDQLEHTEQVEKYIKQTTLIVWLMVIHDPPVVMFSDCKHGEPFNKVIFKEYTLSGEVYDYLVWPALLLTEDGLVLKKGIVQPIAGAKPRKTKSKKSSNKIQPDSQ